MIAGFRGRHPAAEIALTVANTETIAAGVAAFELDMGMIEGSFITRNWKPGTGAPDELVVFAAPGHPLATSAGLDDNDLLALPDPARAWLWHSAVRLTRHCTVCCPAWKSCWSCSIPRRSARGGGGDRGRLPVTDQPGGSVPPG